MKFDRSTLRSVLTWVVLAAAVYFGNIQVQSFLGRRALASTGLEPETSLTQALAVARAEGKLVLVDVSAIWCGSCRKLDGKVLSDPEVKRVLAKDFVFTRLEYESDEGESFVAQHGLRGLPTLNVLDAEGRLVRPLGVTYDPEAFRRQLESVARPRTRG